MFDASSHRIFSSHGSCPARCRDISAALLIWFPSLKRGQGEGAERSCCSERMGRAASWGLSWLRLAVSNPAADRRVCRWHSSWGLCFYPVFRGKLPRMVVLGQVWWGCDGLWQMQEVLVLSWVWKQSWLPNVQWSLVPVLCPNQKGVLVWAELFRFKESKMPVPSVLKPHLCPKQNQTLPKLCQMEMLSTWFLFQWEVICSILLFIAAGRKRVWMKNMELPQCATWLGSVYTELEKSRIREEHSKLNLWSKFSASPDRIRALSIMLDVASEVNFLAHLLISCHRVLRQGSQWPWWFPFPPQVFFQSHSSPQA